MASGTADRSVEAVRRFTRFYTRQLGLLQEGLLQTPHTMTEARLIWELAQHEQVTAARLARELELDAGQLSRVLRRLQECGLVTRSPSEHDRRQQLLSLTASGREAFGVLDGGSRRQVEAMLQPLAPPERERLLRAMATVERLLGGSAEPRVPYMLRPPHSGDYGWVVQRHGVLYNEEHGWDETFEALVAEIMGHYVRDLDASRERGWIAEREGENVGCVFLVRHPEREGVAKLRLLLVEPAARGLGIGRRLVQECTRFARRAGYHTLTLWTQSVLVAARAIYGSEGYRLVAEEPNRAFGHDLVSETWELAL